jgi:choline dehydrogenase
MADIESYDYVITGGGSAGCVLAARLSEDPACKVLLLEAGKPDRHMWLALPLKFRDLMTDPRFQWNYYSEPEPYLNNRRLLVPRGKALGGSSSINGMIYCRGHASDYDRWAQLGLSGWSYNDILPYFKRSENFHSGGNAFHGHGGPLSVSAGDRKSKAYQAYLAAGKALGHRNTGDHNGAVQDGFGPADYTIHNGRRGSVSKRFLEPVTGRPNLKILSGVHVTRVIFENSHACGVEYISGGERLSVRADREVLLCGGAYNSPQLLMLSGIGPAAHLKEHDIDVVHDAPDVGQHLQDHISVMVGYRSDQMAHYLNDFRFDRLALSALQWALFSTGKLATQPVASLAYIKTRPELVAPDIELLMNRIDPTTEVWFPGIRKPKAGFLGCRIILLHPESRGSVTLRSANPLDHAKIVHNYLAAENDRTVLRNGFKHARELYDAEPLKSMVQGETIPGSDIASDDEIDNYIRETGSMLFHPTSTCRMGVDTAAVVNGELKVNGVSGLRVVDASVMPYVIGGHTNAPTIMIAEKAADMILGRRALPAETPALEAAQ